jgi:hypothetical protein
MIDQDEISAGHEIAGGRYRIVETIGEGSMGRVFRAYDCRLETDVVLKFPLPPGAALSNSALLERFAREVRSLVTLSHPHIVRIIDAGELDGRPYVVLQYLARGSLSDRMARDGRMLPLATLRAWLAEVARALDFIHGQGFIHRDVKAANILFDVHENPFLGDFGIIKTLAAGHDSDLDANTKTAPGFLVGTPSYVAPEIVLGQPSDGRSDQYSLALTVYEVLTGRNIMAGPSPSATLVNQAKIDPPPLVEVLPTVPRRVSDAIKRALSKDPAARFPTCAAFAQEVLAHVPSAAGESQDLDAGVKPHWSHGSGQNTAFTFAPRPARAGMARRRTVVTVASAAILGVLGGVAAWSLGLWPNRNDGQSDERHLAARPAAGSLEPPVTIYIAYGTEKKRWLEDALKEFQTTSAGSLCSIRLVPMGSVEGARAVLDGPGKVPIHVWSPASSAYRDVFEREWAKRHKSAAILETHDLFLTPMVFVMWKSRHDAFVGKYGKVSFRTIANAMRESRGWDAIAQRPEWGLSFKFSHTDPRRSNSGLMTLVLVAYDFAEKQRGLALDDINRVEFRSWLDHFERGLVRRGQSLSHSTGSLMEEMVKRGPSEYDCLFVYENLAVDFMKHARERWGDQGELAVIYPEPNIWNENPYYILDVPWSSAEHRAAASRFLEFLMSEPIQRKALEHGFRPGNPAVGVHFPASPLVKAAQFGVRIDIPRTCEPPRAEIVTALLEFSNENNP